MCDGDKACGPCEAANTSKSIAVVQQAGPKQEIAIWGPMSVEIPSRDKKLIRLAAVERSLPSFLRRGRFSLMHGDNNVGEASPLLKIDQARLPNDAKIRVMVNEVTAKYGGLPTGIIPVSQAIADVFPKLRKFVGKPVAFTGGPIFEDDRIGKTVRQEILEGKLDSFSIAGAAFKSRRIQWCDETSCDMVDEVPDLDLSMVTLCTSNGQRSSFGQAQAQNPGAAFVVIQQAECPGCNDPACPCNLRETCDCGTVSKLHLEGCSMQGQEVKQGVTGYMARGVAAKYKKSLGLAQGECPACKKLMSGCTCQIKAPLPMSQAEATSKVPLQWQGLPLVVENVKGSTRRGVGRDGLPWERQMLAHYGYIKRTEGNDGDGIDFYLGDNLASDYVLVINQLKEDGSLDEHKCILGCADLDSALALYKSHYPPDFKCGPAKSMTVADFKDWLKNGDTSEMVQASDHEDMEDSAIGDLIEEVGKLKKAVATNDKKAADDSLLLMEHHLEDMQKVQKMESIGEADITTATPGLENQTYGATTMPMGKWPNFDACVLDMTKDGHSDESARKICGSIKAKVEQADSEVQQIIAQAKADSTAGGVKIDTSNGGAGDKVTQTPIVQATTGSSGVETVIVTTSTIKQADVTTASPNGQKAKAAVPELHGEDPIQLDMMRRIENVEQQVALLKGQRTENPAKEDDPMPETKMDEKNESPAKEKAEEKTEDKMEDEKEAMYQASKADFAALIKQAVAEALPAAIAAALKQAREAPPSVETPVPAPIQQAGKKTIETPIPASPTPLSNQNDPEIQRLQQALDASGPSGFREVMNFAFNRPKE